VFPRRGDVSDFQKITSAFSETPIVLLFYPTGGDASDFQEAKNDFSEPPIVLYFCPHRWVCFGFPESKECFLISPMFYSFHPPGWCFCFQKAKSAFFSEPLNYSNVFPHRRGALYSRKQRVFLQSSQLFSCFPPQKVGGRSDFQKEKVLFQSSRSRGGI